jgi:hypothetical protein
LLKRHMIAGDYFIYCLCICKVCLNGSLSITSIASIHFVLRLGVAQRFRAGVQIQPSQSKPNFCPLLPSTSAMSMSGSDILSQLPNLDDASKAEISKVITEETRKSEFQGSIYPKHPTSPNENLGRVPSQRLTCRYPQTRKHVLPLVRVTFSFGLVGLWVGASRSVLGTSFRGVRGRRVSRLVFRIV